MLNHTNLEFRFSCGSSDFETHGGQFFDVNRWAVYNVLLSASKRDHLVFIFFKKLLLCAVRCCCCCCCCCLLLLFVVVVCCCCCLLLLFVVVCCCCLLLLFVVVVVCCFLRHTQQNSFLCSYSVLLFLFLFLSIYGKKKVTIIFSFSPFLVLFEMIENCLIHLHGKREHR